MNALKDFSALWAGAEIPTLEVSIDRLALIKYAGAADDYVAQHWDQSIVATQGYPDVIAHGWLVFAHMTRAVTDWIPSHLARVGNYSVRYHRPFHPGILTCGGTVTQMDAGNAHFSLWGRNADGDTVATGRLTLLKAKSSKPPI